MPQSGTAGLDKSAILNLLRKLNTAFHSGCTNLHCHHSAQGFPFLSTASATLAIFFDRRDAGVRGTDCGFDLQFPDD